MTGTGIIPTVYKICPRLWRTNNSKIFLLFLRHKPWYSVVSLGRCILFPSRVGLRTYQHPCSTNISSPNLGATVLNSTANRQTETCRMQAECLQFRVFPCLCCVLNVGYSPLFQSHFWNSVYFAMMLYLTQASLKPIVMYNFPAA